MGLPPGFVLDQPEAPIAPPTAPPAAAGPRLPPGFQLDAPAAPPVRAALPLPTGPQLGDFPEDPSAGIPGFKALQDENYLVRGLGRGYQRLGGAVDTMAADAREQNITAIDKWTQLTQSMETERDPTVYRRLSTARAMLERDLRTAAPGDYDLNDPKMRDALKQRLGARAGENVVSYLGREETIRKEYPREPITDAALTPPPAEKNWAGLPDDPSFSESLGRFWNAFSKAPVTVATDIAVESVPTTAAAIGSGLLTRSPGVMMGMMGALSGAQEYGGGIMEALRESGVDMTKPEAILAGLRDPVIGATVREKAALKAIPVAAIDMLSMRLAGMMLAPKSMAPVPRHATNAVAQVGQGATLGGAGEAAGQLASQGKIKSWEEIFAEVVAEGAMGPVEALGMRHAFRGQPAPPDAPPKAADPAAPATSPTTPTVPPEVTRILAASGIGPESPLYKPAVAAITQRLQGEAARPAPGAYDVAPQGQGPQAAAASVDASVDAQRRALELETAAREAMGAGMATFTDPATGQEVSTARAPVVPRTAPPPVIALPQSPDYVPGRNQEETARVEQARSLDAEAVAMEERGAAEALQRFIAGLESPPAGAPVRNEFAYTDEARRPLNAGELLDTPAAQRLAEAQGVRPDQPISRGAAATLNKFGAAEGQRQAQADRADQALGPFTVSDTNATAPGPGLGTNAKSPPQDAARVLREREGLQREYEYALGQATNQTITDTERAKWRKKAETIKTQIDGLSDKLAERARTAGEFENKAARTKEQVLDKDGASVSIGTSDRPFRTKSSTPEASFTPTAEDRRAFAKAIGISERDVQANPMARATFEAWMKDRAQADTRARTTNDETFAQDARSTFEKLRDRRIEDLEAEYARRRSEGRAKKNDEEARVKGEAEAGTEPKGLDESGNYFVDENKFVLSDKGGPILFQTQKDAGRWILKYGNKQSRDQVFDIANHPTVFGKFTVQERMRRNPKGAEAKPSKGALVPAGKPQPKGGDPKSQAQATPKGEAQAPVEQDAAPDENTGQPIDVPDARVARLNDKGKPEKKTDWLEPPDSFKPTPQQMGEARSVIARLLGRGPKRKPERLIAAIISAGGIKPGSVGADNLRAMDLHKRPGFFSNGKRAMTVEEAIDRVKDFDPKYGSATDKGGRGERTRMSIDEFLELVADDAGNRPVYRPDSEQTLSFADKEGGIQRLLDMLSDFKIATTSNPRQMAWLLSLEPQEARLHTLLSIQRDQDLNADQSLELNNLLDREFAAAEEAEYRAATENARPEAFDPELEATYEGTFDEAGPNEAAETAGARTASPEGAAKPEPVDAPKAAPEQRADAQREAPGTPDRGAERASEPRKDGRAAERDVKADSKVLAKGETPPVHDISEIVNLPMNSADTKGFVVYRAKTEEQGYYYEIYKDGRSVGNAMLRKGSRQVGGVVVNKEAQRQGIGQMLYATIEKDIGARLTPTETLSNPGKALWAAYTNSAWRQPAVEKTDQGDQTVLPGAEKISDKALAERKMQGKAKPTVRQKAPDEGLFDTGAQKQTDLLDQAAPKHDAPHEGLTPGAREFANKHKNDPDGLAKRVAATAADVKSLASQFEARKGDPAFMKRFDEANQKLADLEDALEWVTQTVAEREASRLSSKFSSNPFMDPKLWGAFFRMVDPRKATRFFAAEAQAWMDQFQHVAELFSKGSRKAKGNPILDLMRTLVYSNDGMLLTLAHRYSVDGKANPAIQEFRKLWHAQAGRQSNAGTAATYGEAVAERTQARLNDLSKIIAPLKGKDRKTANAILSAAAAKMRSKNIPLHSTNPVDVIARGLRDFFAQELKYQRDAGISIGKVEGYLPRAVDMYRVHADVAGFLKDATQAYRANGAKSEAEARAMAEAWLDHLMMGDLGVSASENDLVMSAPAGTKPSFEKSREFNRAAEKTLEKWYIQDPAELAADYLVRGTRRTELARRLGPELEKWAEFKERFAETGAAEAIPEIIDIVRSSAGLYPGIKHRGARHAVAAARLLTPLTYLERATITSLSEPTIIGARASGMNILRDIVPIDTLGAYLKTIAGLVQRARGHKTAATELAEDMGLIGDATHGTLMHQRFGGQVDAKWAQEAMSGFFKRTGLHDFTDETRTVSMGVAQVFLRRLALRTKDATDHPMWGTKKSTEFLLGELGVPADQMKKFADYVLKAPNGMPSDDAVRGVDVKDPMARLYRSAMTRFIDQSIMRPKAAERQRWANHPVGAVFYGITSFISSFHKNVLMRGLSMAGQSVDPKSGLSAYERLNFLAPIMRIGVYTVAAQFALTFLRDLLWDDPAKDPEKKRELDKPGALGVDKRVWLAISRSGMLGLWDIPYNWAFASKYTKDPAAVLSGPFLSGVGEVVKSIINLASERNSANTNTFERAATKSVFDYAVSPVLNFMFSLMPGGMGSAIGAVGIQTTTHPKFLEDTINKPLWGPPRWQTQGSGSNNRGGREGREGRSSGR